MSGEKVKLDIQGTISIVSEKERESQDGANSYYNERQENHHYLSIPIIVRKRDYNPRGFGKIL